MFLTPLASFAAREKLFLGGLFGNSTPFKIEAADVSSSRGSISNNSRKIRIKLLYLKTLSTSITGIKKTEFENAVDRSLTLLYADYGSEQVTNYPQDLSFELEFRKLAADDNDFYEAQFISNELVVNSPIKLFFKFNIKKFLELTNIQSSSSDDTVQSSLVFAPLMAEINNPILTARPDLTNKGEDLFEAQMFSGDFSTAYKLDEDAASTVRFTFTKNSKPSKPFIKTPKQKIALEPAVIEGQTLSFSELEAGKYAVQLPLRLILKNQNLQSSLSAGQSYGLRLPIQIITYVDNGLELRLNTKLKSAIMTRGSFL
jgi:hypothetical protein